MLNRTLIHLKINSPAIARGMGGGAGIYIDWCIILFEDILNVEFGGQTVQWWVSLIVYFSGDSELTSRSRSSHLDLCII